MSKKYFILAFTILLSGLFSINCQKKVQTEPVLSETPQSREEIEAGKFADEASFDISSYYLKKAIDNYKNQENWEKVIQNYIKLGNNYRIEGNYELALINLNAGLDIALAHSGYKYSELARSYHKLAFKHLRKKDYRKALDLYHKALSLKITVFGKYHSEVSKSYNSIALVLLNMGDLKTAEAYYYKSLMIRLKRFENIDEDFFRNFKFLDRNRLKQKFYTEAKRELNKSLKVYLETYGGSHHLSAIIYENIGIIYSLEGDFERAMGNFRKALRIRIELFGEESLEVADTFHDIGTLLILKNNLTDAERYLKDSLKIKITKLGNNHLFTGDTFFQLGKLNFLAGKYDMSLRFLQDSLISLRRGFKPVNICENPSLEGDIYFKRDILKVLRLKAEAFEKKYSFYLEREKDLLCSYETYSIALKLVDIIRDRYRSEEYELGFESESQEIYGKAVEVSYRLFKLTNSNKYKEGAIYFLEKSKAALLSKMIMETEAMEFSGIPEELLRKENELKKEIVRLEILLEKEFLRGIKSSKKRFKILEENYFEMKIRYKELIDLFEKKYEKYFKLKYKKKIPGINEIKEGIDQNSAIIEYYQSGNNIYIFLISKEIFKIFEVSTPSGFREWITEFNRSIVKIEENLFLKTGPLLYNLLIDPVYKYIKDKKRIIIIPDGELFLIPFEALIPDSERQTSFSELEYLVKDHSISYHYSMALYNSRSKKEKEKGWNNFLGFAPVFKWKTSALMEQGIKSLPKLPGSYDEVRSIMDIFASGGFKIKGFFYGEATESKLKEELGKSYFDFVHIATHTVSNTENPTLSGLIFSGNDEDLEEDGILFSKEIYTLHLKTKLLVLSSCESGVGKLIKGEGVLSLNRGFFYSGADNIIFSLWNVEERSTKKLMIELYKKILKKIPFAESLREAKLSLISDPYTAFPKYWSSFILFGR
ncbi:MAG: CHAT domain-containing tetratricopeptide repeat protein [Acidobacteriota bacterium]